MKQRDFHKVAIIKRQVRGFTSVIESKKRYKRHQKHKKSLYRE
jgi:hypothetical protein